MENNENNVQNQVKKQSKGMPVGIMAIMLIAVLIIGIGGGYWLSKNDSLFNKNETSEKTKEMTADEIYAVYSKNMQNKIKSLGKDLPKELEGNSWVNIKYMNNTKDFPVVSAYVNEKLEACVAIKETGDKIKILDNAINCGVCSSGNGGTLYVIWAVDTTGNLYTKTYNTQDTANKMNFSLVKNQGLKNIVEVIQCSGPSTTYPLAVDISGNTYNL